MPEAGWLLLLLFLGICALIVVAVLWPSFRRATEVMESSTPSTQRTDTLAQRPTPQINTVPDQRELSLKQWLTLVNDQPDQIPHLFIEGGSGSGKSTIATAILHDRRDPIAVIGVKPDDGWGIGYVYRSEDRPAALAALLADVRRRLDMGDKSGLTIVLDDFTRLASQHREAVDLYKEVADVGRSLRIRLILIARGRQVKGIGASGESDLLDHFVFLTISRDRHRAKIELDEETYPLDTAQVKSLARTLPAARWWQPPQTQAISHRNRVSDFYVDDLDVPVRDYAGEAAGIGDRTSTRANISTQHQQAVPDENEIEERFDSVPAVLTSDAIRTLYNAGWSKNRIATLLRGTKGRRLAIINAALEEVPATH